MKKVKQLAAMAAAVLMMVSIAPSNRAYALNTSAETAENNSITEDKNSNQTYDVTIKQENVTRNSMKISWDDEDYADNSYTVMAYSTKLTAPSYGSNDNHILNVSNSNTVELTNLVGGMPYKIVIYKHDSKDNSTKVIAENILNTEADFLVLVGESLYKDSGIVKSLNRYVQDLRYEEGIGAEIVRISESEESEEVNKCTTPEQVKEIIKKKYDNGNGAEGFVIIGSGEDIPTAFYKSPFNNNVSIGVPTDVYFADMDGVWQDTDNDGSFDKCGNEPEMYFGRIDTKGVANYIDKSEAEVTKSYLDRVNKYRECNGNLDSVSANRALSFVDNKSFRIYKQNVYDLASVMPYVEGVYDEDETSVDNWINKLNDGYALIYLTSHSLSNFNSFDTIDSCGYIHNYDVLDGNKVTPKFNFMDLSACYACLFENSKKEIYTDMGSSYLFKECSSGINIIGATSPTNNSLDTDKEFYSDLSNKVSIGQAFKNSFKRKPMDEAYGMVLFGDPTSKYYLNKQTNDVPCISNNFAGEGNRRMTVTTKECYCIKTVDEDDDNVYYDLYIDGVKADAERIGKNLYWSPDDNLAGKTHSAVIESYNKDAEGNKINSYKEKFNVDVKAGDNNSKFKFEAEDPGNYISAGYIDQGYVKFTDDNNASVQFNNVSKIKGSYDIVIKNKNYKNRNVVVEYSLNGGFSHRELKVEFDNSGVAIINTYENLYLDYVKIKADGEGLPDIDCIEFVHSRF